MYFKAFNLDDHYLLQRYSSHVKVWSFYTSRENVEWTSLLEHIIEALTYSRFFWKVYITSRKVVKLKQSVNTVFKRTD